MTTIHLKRVADITAADWSVWLDICARSGVYESPYFRPEFVRAVAAVRNDVEIAIVVQGGQTVGFFPFERGNLNLGKPVGGKLSDYHGPIVRCSAPLDAHELLAASRLASWDFDHFVCASSALVPFITIRDRSPQLDLSEGFDSYARRRREAGSDTLHRQGQKTRKMTREVGPLHFDFDVNDDEALELLKRWKSEQLARTGLADVFASPWTLALLGRLREHRGEDFSAPLSVLRAGDKIAAVCLSLRSRGVLHAWFTAYNPELHAYSPGLALLLRLAAEAQSLGIRKIDLGRGDERYKRSLASGSVEVGEGSISTRSLAMWLRSGWRQTRDWMANSPLPAPVGLSGKLLKPIRKWLAYR